MKAVIFDLDDTLYQELDYVRSGFEVVAGFLERRYGTDPARTAGRMIELLRDEGRGRVFDRIIEELGIDAGAEVVPTMLYLYRSHRPRLTPFADVPGTLRSLAEAGLRLGVLTDGLASVQRRKLEALDLGVNLDLVVVVGELPLHMAKPAAGAYRVAADLLELPPSEITYVGNDPYKDFAGARATGMGTLRVRAPSDTFPRAADAWRDDADQYVDPFEAIVDVVAGG